MLHGILEVAHLALHLGRAVVFFELLRSGNVAGIHGYPLVFHVIVAQPQVAHAHKVARMVQREVQELLLHQRVPVALHDCTLGHGLHVGERVVSLALTSLGGLHRRVERTVLVCQVGISLVARLVVKATERNVVGVHSIDVVVGSLVDKSAFVGFQQRGSRYGIHRLPQVVRLVTILIVRHHLPCLAFRIRHIIHTCQGGKAGIVLASVL